MVSIGIDVSKDKHDCFILSSEGEVLADAFTVPNNMEGFTTLLERIQDCTTPQDKMGLLTKCLFIYSERKKGSKKDAHRRHPMYFIILFKFKAVAERRQWSSAASKPRRKTRVKLCPHFWAANVPSHQTCRLRSASR